MVADKVGMIWTNINYLCQVILKKKLISSDIEAVRFGADAACRAANRSGLTADLKTTHF